MATDKKADARAQENKGYMGGKGQDGVFQTIINQIAPCTDYWELFAGDASIHKHLNPKPQRCILVEKDQKQAKRLAKRLSITLVYTFDTFLLKVLSYEKEGIFIVWGSAFDVLKYSRMEDMDTPGSYFFVDPPYMHETRQTTRYKNELTDSEHVLLLAFLRNFRLANIAITTYPNETYKLVLQQWRKVEYKAVTRNRGEVKTEHLYMNYDYPNVLQCTDHRGNDYREREAYRKQEKNWEKNFISMHPHQQQVIIKKLTKRYNDLINNGKLP